MNSTFVLVAIILLCNCIYIEVEEVPEKPTTMPQVTDKFYQIMLYRIGLTTGGSQPLNFGNNFTFEYSSNNNIFAFVAMSADSVPSSKTNIFQNKLIYCRQFRTYSRWAELLRLIQKRCSFTIICVQVWNWILSPVHLYPYSFFLFLPKDTKMYKEQ
jgi:hypothetical protein